MDKNIDELVVYVNTELKNGLSTASIEKKLNVGKDTIRKKLNRANYRYNKELNQYITQDNTGIIKDETQITQDNTKYITHENTESYKIKKDIYNNKNNIIMEEENMEIQAFKELNITEKIDMINNLTQGKKNLKDVEEQLGFTNVGKYMDKNLCFWNGTTKTYELIKKEGQFSVDEVAILKEVIKNHNLQQDIKNLLNIDDLKDKTITTRSFRSYKEVMDGFATYCKENKLNQAECLAIALLDFIKKQ